MRALHLSYRRLLCRSAWFLLTGFFLSAIPGIACAAVTFGSVIVNLSESADEMARLIVDFSYVAGWFFIVKALYTLRRSADHRSMMYTPLDMSGPLAMIMIGWGLTQLGTIIDITTNTFWGTIDPTVISLDDTVNGGENTVVLKALFEIVRVIGLFAFVRGWVLLTKLSQSSQAGQGMAGKGITHVIGGLLAYHIESTVLLIANTIGYTINT